MESCSHICAPQTLGVSQTLQELDFERGIWSAAMDGDITRVIQLLSSGTAPSTLDSAGYTALHYAARSGHQEVCECLISSGANVNCQTPGGVTALHRASYCGHLSVVETLLRHKADPGLRDSDGQTPLHKAAARGHYSVAEVLVTTLPSQISTRDQRGQLPADIVNTLTSQWEQLLKLS